MEINSFIRQLKDSRLRDVFVTSKEWNDIIIFSEKKKDIPCPSVAMAPIFDKKFGVFIFVATAWHIEIMSGLFCYHDQNEEIGKDNLLADEYIKSGFGWFISTISCMPSMAGPNNPVVTCGASYQFGYREKAYIKMINASIRRLD